MALTTLGCWCPECGTIYHIPWVPNLECGHPITTGPGPFKNCNAIVLPLRDEEAVEPTDGSEVSL